MNLYKLELQKIRLSSYIWCAFGIFAGLLALGILFLIILQVETGNGGSQDVELFDHWNGLLALITALAFACFSVLSAAVAAKAIVSEYCKDNAAVLLSYPVKRKAVLAAKCLMVCTITTVCAFVSNVSAVGIVYVIAQFMKTVPQMTGGPFALTVCMSSILMGILSSAAGLASAAFGYRRRSGIAAIVCSLAIVCVTANLVTISPRRIVWVMLAMSVLFTGAANVICHLLAKKIEIMEV